MFPSNSSEKLDQPVSKFDLSHLPEEMQRAPLWFMRKGNVPLYATNEKPELDSPMLWTPQKYVQFANGDLRTKSSRQLCDAIDALSYASEEVQFEVAINTTRADTLFALAESTPFPMVIEACMENEVSTAEKIDKAVRNNGNLAEAQREKRRNQVAPISVEQWKIWTEQGNSLDFDLVDKLMDVGTREAEVAVAKNVTEPSCLKKLAESTYSTRVLSVIERRLAPHPDSPTMSRSRIIEALEENRSEPVTKWEDLPRY